MNRTVTIESKNHKYQNTYGGNICQLDFCTDYTLGNTISGIISDWAFDRACEKQMDNSIRSYRERKMNNGIR